jgi:hypothetical protein
VEELIKTNYCPEFFCFACLMQASRFFACEIVHKEMEATIEYTVPDGQPKGYGHKGQDSGVHTNMPTKRHKTFAFVRCLPMSLENEIRKPVREEDDDEWESENHFDVVALLRRNCVTNTGDVIFG